MSYSLTREEMETHIRWDAAEKIAHIFTADPVSIRKLDKLVDEYPETYKLVKDDNYGGKFYEVSSKYIRFGKPASEAQKEAARLHSFKPRSKAENHAGYADENEVCPGGR